MSNAKTLISIEAQYEDKGSASFLPISLDKEAVSLPTEAACDLAIIKASEKITFKSIEALVKNLKPLRSEDAFTLFKDEGTATGIETKSAGTFENFDQTPCPKYPEHLPSLQAL